VTYYLDGPVREYRDLLRNDAELFCGLRLAAMEHGVFELPLNLKRSHFSYAHREGDVATLLRATEAAWHAVGRS
jgi:glutamate-1-semialdehyde 2,1-aminomutase